MNSKKAIAVVGGGYSGEYSISILSAKTVCTHLPKDLFDVYPITISRDGWYADLGGDPIEVDKNDFSIFNAGKKVTFDCVFVAIHGTPGEDGKLQGYLDMINMPYTSGNTDNLSATFNKATTQAILASVGVRVARFELYKNGDLLDTETIATKIGYPCFVKPANGGSSIGASKVSAPEQLQTAVTKALQQDGEILIEQYLKGTELTCGVTVIDGEVLALPATEIVTENEFFDYEAKYVGSKTQEITPARITDKQMQLCQDTSKFVYKQLDCKGTVRIDYFLVGEDFYVIEINTVPGLTDKSFVPQQARAAGISLEKLFTSAINEALAAH